MGRYRYRAKDRLGRDFYGDIEGVSRQAAAAELRQRGWYVTKLQQADCRARQLSLPAIFHHTKKREVVLFCRELAALLKAGLALQESMRIMQVQRNVSALQAVLGNVLSRLEAGQSMAASLQAEKGLFPHILICMVAAGEASGTLDAGFACAADYLEREYKAAAKAASALLYPGLLLLMTIAIVGFIMAVILPLFVDLFVNLHAELPLPTRILLQGSSWLRQYWWMGAAGLLTVLGAGWKMYARPGGRLLVDSWLLRLPVLGELIYKRETMRVSRALAVLLQSGLAIDDAVGIAKEVSGNERLGACFEKARQDLRRGYSLSQSLGQENCFDSLFLQLVTVGETGGDIDGMLQKIADFYALDVAVLSERMLTLLEPTMILGLGLVVALVVFSVALPVFEAVAVIH